VHILGFNADNGERVVGEIEAQGGKGKLFQALVNVSE